MRIFIVHLFFSFSSRIKVNSQNESKLNEISTTAEKTKIKNREKGEIEVNEIASNGAFDWCINVFIDFRFINFRKRLWHLINVPVLALCCDRIEGPNDWNDFVFVRNAMHRRKIIVTLNTFNRFHTIDRLPSISCFASFFFFCIRWYICGMRYAACSRLLSEKFVERREGKKHLMKNGKWTKAKKGDEEKAINWKLVCCWMTLSFNSSHSIGAWFFR